jgi:hypothetical protein
MTAIASGPTRSRTGTHRAFMFLGALAITLAVATTFAVVLLTSSSTPSRTTTPLEPVVVEELTETQRLCLLARVEGC